MRTTYEKFHLEKIHYQLLSFYRQKHLGSDFNGGKVPWVNPSLIEQKSTETRVFHVRQIYCSLKSNCHRRAQAWIMLNLTLWILLLEIQISKEYFTKVKSSCPTIMSCYSLKKERLTHFQCHGSRNVRDKDMIGRKSEQLWQCVAFQCSSCLWLLFNIAIFLNVFSYISSVSRGISMYRDHVSKHYQHDTSVFSVHDTGFQYLRELSTLILEIWLPFLSGLKSKS